MRELVSSPVTSGPRSTIHRRPDQIAARKRVSEAAFIEIAQEETRVFQDLWLLS
jgi:hypothetical protein